MYRIGNFSTMTALSVKALRYYDEIGLLKPVKVDEENGYRWYDESSYQTAITIRTLKNFEFSIQEMLEAVPQIKDRDDLAAYLLDKHQQISVRMAAARNLQKQIESQVAQLKEDYIMSRVENIQVKDMPALQIASIRYKGKYSDMGQYIGQLYKAVGGQATGPVMGLYHDEGYMEDGADIEVAVAVKKAIEKGDVHTRMLEACKCVSAIHIGPYEEISNSYKEVMDFIGSKQLVTMVPSREVYHKGPGMLLKGNPQKYETEILLQLV